MHVRIKKVLSKLKVYGTASAAFKGSGSIFHPTSVAIGVSFCLLAWFVVDGKAFVGASMIAVFVRVAVANDIAIIYIDAEPRQRNFFFNARPLTIHPIFIVSNLGHQSILLT